MKMNNVLNIKDKIYDAVEKDADLLDFLKVNGFENLNSEKSLETFGKMITLEQALKSKGISEEIFVKKYLEYSGSKLLTEEEEKEKFSEDRLNIMGVLPCPIRMPLLDILEKFGEKNKEALEYNFDLRSANLGMEFLKERMSSDNFKEFPDLVSSAGMELFYGNEKTREFLDKGYFKTPDFPYNKEFCNDEVNLKDPKGNFQILGVVPAVFLINEKYLNGRKAPESWEDLLSEEFRDSVSIPLNDLDLFNAIILTIYAKYGYEGIEKLADSFNGNLHPSQMVKKSVNPSAVSIAPYFFATMVRENSGIKFQWPKDGAIISPIFLMAKKDKLNELKPILEYFNSDEVAEVFSANGKFPSTKKGFDNNLDDKKFMWLGWEFLNNRDLPKVYSRCLEIFEERNGVEV